MPRPGPGSWIGAAVWAALAIGFGLGGDALRAAGRYDRDAIAGGEYWRLLTGHLVHLGWSHVLLNLAGLAVLGLAVGSYLGFWAWLGAGIVSALAIDAGLYWLYPQIPWYVGLSGILHGFWAAGAWQAWTSERRVAVALAALLAGKLAWEQLVGAAPWSTGMTGGTVVVEAHWLGAAGGLAFALAAAATDRLRGRPV